VFLQTFSEYTGAFGALVRERLRGVEVVSVHCKTQHCETDLIGLNARQLADAMVHLAGFLEAGRALGAGIYVFHGLPRVRQSTRTDFSRWQAGIQAAIDLSASYGIRLCYETVSWAWFNEPARVKQFLAVWPSLSFVLDVKQVLEMGQDPVDYVEAMGARLAHVHVLDFDRDGRPALPGQGAHDFRELARALSKGRQKKVSLRALVAHLPPPVRDKFESVWKVLETRVQECKRLNVRNAHLLMTQRDIMQRVLDIEPHVYAPP
jgi:sugar phosphate isomerase/epimerase